MGSVAEKITFVLVRLVERSPSPLARDTSVVAYTLHRLGKICLIILCIPHPEWLYHYWTAKDGKLYDSYSNIAGTLASIKGPRCGLHPTKGGLDEAFPSR